MGGNTRASVRTPKRISLTFLDQGERIGRLTVLVWHAPGRVARNLFTLMRHRKREALGPWSSKPDATWTREELGDDLSLLSFTPRMRNAANTSTAPLQREYSRRTDTRFNTSSKTTRGITGPTAISGGARRCRYAARSRCTAPRLPNTGVSRTNPTNNGCRCRIGSPDDCAWRFAVLVFRSTAVRSESATFLSLPPKTRSRVDSARITTGRFDFMSKPRGCSPRHIARPCGRVTAGTKCFEGKCRSHPDRRRSSWSPRWTVPALPSAGISTGSTWTSWRTCPEWRRSLRGSGAGNHYGGPGIP